MFYSNGLTIFDVCYLSYDFFLVKLVIILYSMSKWLEDYRSSDPFYTLTYYIKWETTSWT